MSANSIIPAYEQPEGTPTVIFVFLRGTRPGAKGAKATLIRKDCYHAPAKGTPLPDYPCGLVVVAVHIVVRFAHAEAEGGAFTDDPQGNIACNVLQAIIDIGIRL